LNQRSNSKSNHFPRAQIDNGKQNHHTL